jgi:cysteine desulfurase
VSRTVPSWGSASTLDPGGRCPRRPRQASRDRCPTLDYRGRVPDATTPAALSSAPGRVHLDAGGSARLLPDAHEAFTRALAEGWADPRRLHSEGRRAASMLDGARAAVAEVLGARTEEVHFAPSHAAAQHAAVRAVTLGRRRVGGSVVTSAVERAAVLEASGFAVRRHQSTVEGSTAEHVVVPVGRSGAVDLDALESATTAPGVSLLALQHSNGEVGTLQPLARAHEVARAARVPLLVDAGAAVGHVPVGDDWDVLTADPADWGGPGGTGVLVVRQSVRWQADWPEDQDRWFPGGTNVPAAFAAAVALQAATADRAAQDARRRALVDTIRTQVPLLVPDVDLVGDPVDRLPHVVTFSCLYVDGEALVGELDRAGFAVGSGSACTSSALEPSHVLAAMGSLTHGNVRTALDRSTTADDVDRFLAVLPGAVARVRAALGVESL